MKVLHAILLFSLAMIPPGRAVAQVDGAGTSLHHSACLIVAVVHERDLPERPERCRSLRVDEVLRGSDVAGRPTRVLDLLTDTTCGVPDQDRNAGRSVRCCWAFRGGEPPRLRHSR